MKQVILVGLLFCQILALVGCERKATELPQSPTSPSVNYDGTIVAMGDSLTAGLGVEEAEAYPALLDQLLRKQGLNWRVINAGVSGETSSGALERTKWVLSFAPDVVILETGANDGLRGIDPELTRKNIAAIIGLFRQSEVKVVLCGMDMVRNMGEEYTSRFAAIYPTLAKDNEVLFMPFFLEGVAGEAGLNQADGIHPTATGYQRVVVNLLPTVLEAIRTRSGEGN
ncbi:MAG: arylesterase [Proteobacteria bacterium]|nr:arylesterase [Pseudomonadota bacterium]MBU1688838.1 arylesterase [Pseudomonadota bacterium]